MGLIAPRQQVLVHGRGVVSHIQAEMLRLLGGGRGAADDQVVQGRTQQAHIMAIGAIDDQAQRNPGSIGQETALRSSFAAIGRVSSGRGAGERG